MNVLALIFSILFLASTPTSFAKPTKPLNGLSIDLIHRDSPLSPFYNSSMTPSERSRNAVLRSFSRSNHFQAALNEDEAELAETTIHRSIVGDYIMKFCIGTPPVETYGSADTGSDLIWVQCEPCLSCYPQIIAPIFNPKRSSTFKSVSCDSKPCSFLPEGQYTCGNSKECSYNFSYQDKSYTKGELAMESISLTPSKGGQSVPFPKSVFGCGHNNNRLSPRDSAGVVGLGGGPLSLVSQLRSQLGNKFSYCLLPPSSNSPSKLKFGNDAVISGRKGVVSTPLFPLSSYPTFHILRLEGITVGQKTVKNNVENGGQGNIVIDSGTSFTYLPSSFYNQFEGLLKEAIGVEALQNPPKQFKLCYRSNTNLPDAVFHFANANVVLKPVNLFIPSYTKDSVCLAVVPSAPGVVPYYGNVAQINFEVEYDLDKKMVSFAPADCTKV